MEKNTRHTKKGLSSLCNHYDSVEIVKHSTDIDFLVEACTVCPYIRVYNLNTGDVSSKSVTGMVRGLCSGSPGYVFVIDIHGQLQQLKLSSMLRTFSEAKALKTKISNAWEIFYVNRIVLVVSRYPDQIQVLDLEEGSTLWINSGKTIDPTSITSGSFGRVYVGGYRASGVLVMDRKTGMLLHELLLDKLNFIMMHAAPKMD